MNVLPNQFELLSRLMDASQTRHSVVSQNVANVETPGYQRLEVNFEEALARELSASHSKQKTPAAIEIVIDDASPMRADGNNVDIDREMGVLSKNAMLYQTYSQLLASKLSMMQRAMSRS